VVLLWLLVVQMFKRQPKLSPKIQPNTKPLIWAFFVLALGDTAYVVLLAWAMASGSLENTISLFGIDIGLVGIGALASAITITLFYFLVLVAWQRRYNQALSWFEYMLLAAGVIRLVMLALPQNQWNNLVPPWPFSLYRYVPLFLFGLGTALLVFQDARTKHDRLYRRIAVLIFCSFIIEIPIVLYVQQAPLLDLLVSPKGLIYLIMAWLVYSHLFQPRKTR